VTRKILRNASMGSSALLRDIVFDPNGNVKPQRLSALLNAALGFAAAGNAEGFVDLDAVPEDGASVKVCQHVMAHKKGLWDLDLRPTVFRS